MNRDATRRTWARRVGGVGAAVALAAGALAACTAPTAQARPDPAERTMIDLGSLGSGYTQARAINDRGQVVGDSGGRAFLWERGVMRDISPEGVTGATTATALNDRGQAIGYAGAARNREPIRPFLWSGGRATFLPTLGGPSASPAAINRLGEIIGNGTDASGVGHALLWVDGQVHDLGPGSANALNDRGQILLDRVDGSVLWDRGRRTVLKPGPGLGLSALGLNDRGTVVGQLWTKYPNDGVQFFWRRGVLTAETETAECSSAMFVNDRDQIASGLRAADGSCHASLRHAGGPAVDLGTLGGPGSQARAFNRRGEVAGVATGAAGDERAVLWTGGRTIDLGTSPGHAFSFAVGINDHGVVVAVSSASRPYPDDLHSFLSLPARTNGER
jgi:probable HAF family extracellular repeat protein